MKKIFTVLLLAIIGGLAANAQNCPIDFLGTKTLYKAPVVKYTPAPIGYYPVFINHVGRHGARHLTKDVNTSLAYSLLKKADSLHDLTPKGQKLLQMVIALDKIEKGNVKSISVEGRSEQQGIGERMYARYSNVFKDNVNLNVAVTKEIRTKQSADAFLSGLKKHLKTEAVIKEHDDDIDLRFYDISPVYKQFEENGDWIKYCTAIEKANHFKKVNAGVIQRFFKSDFLETIDTDSKEKFVSDVFGFATIVYSLKNELSQAGLQSTDVAFISLFTRNEIEALSMLDEADEYYKKGPGIDNNGIQVRIAAPLLIDFLKTSDEFIKNGGINAQLRFAHAETIAPFAALLNISIADRSTKTTNISSVWQASKIIPLSSNIQWIFYKKQGSAQYLVKVLLNEKETHITGMPVNTFPYYRWDDLRKFYLNKLKQLDASPGDDMEAYLNNIK